jgi:hypothetical protein
MTKLEQLEWMHCEVQNVIAKLELLEKDVLGLQDVLALLEGMREEESEEA